VCAPTIKERLIFLVNTLNFELVKYSIVKNNIGHKKNMPTLIGGTPG
jgi:hypothetical protein